MPPPSALLTVERSRSAPASLRRAHRLPGELLRYPGHSVLGSALSGRLVSRLSPALRHARQPGCPSRATGAADGRPAGLHLLPFHHRGVAGPGPEHRGLHRPATAWPSPVDAVPAHRRASHFCPPSIPVLDPRRGIRHLDPPSDVPKVMAQLGGHTRFVELANSTHVVGEDDTTCGDELVAGVRQGTPKPRAP